MMHNPRKGNAYIIVAPWKVAGQMPVKAPHSGNNQYKTSMLYMWKPQQIRLHVYFVTESVSVLKRGVGSDGGGADCHLINTAQCPWYGQMYSTGRCTHRQTVL